jgi:hypothetical protein
MKSCMILFFFVLVQLSPLVAQIPNGGFKEWTTTNGYPSPESGSPEQAYR